MNELAERQVVFPRDEKASVGHRSLITLISGTFPEMKSSLFRWQCVGGQKRLHPRRSCTEGWKLDG